MSATDGTDGISGPGVPQQPEEAVSAQAPVIAPDAVAEPDRGAAIAAVIADAVRRIADEAQAARVQVDASRPPAPVEPVAETPPAPPPLAFDSPAHGGDAAADFPAVAEAIEDTPVQNDFAYVPRSDDRVGPEIAAEVETVRIEPVLEMPPEPGAPEPDFLGSAPQPDLPFDRAGAEPAGLKAGVAADTVAGPLETTKTETAHFQPLTLMRLVKLAGLVAGGYLAAILVLIALYRVVPPPASTLMIYQWLAGTEIRRTWVPIEDISPNLLRAVVVSEDWGFCKHYGIDFEAIEQALEKAGDGIPRGASTISMQVIKNLFLTQSKSYVRKAIEIPLTVVAEAVWPKSRMLEIYLNIAEWGPGVFGAEAAAQHHFAKSAAKLSEREAALLAASLPNPMIRDAGDPGPRTARKASVIQSRMRVAGPVADCAMPPPRPKAPQDWETNVKKRGGVSP